jgi:acetyl esterase/lipase
MDDIPLFKHYFRAVMRIFFLLLLLISVNQNMAQQTIPLYPGNIPGGKVTADKEKSVYNADSILIVSKISRPTITVYLPEKSKATGAAIIVFPGGGYFINALSHEGYDVGERLRSEGIAAFVVKYRIPDKATMNNKETAPLQDAQQAIFAVRSGAKKWGIDPYRIGVLGFSAGGHLASTASTHYRNKLVKAGKLSLRPDFTILIYPVISFSDSIGHIGSRDNLVGKNPSPEKIQAYSNQLLVDAQTPPAFLAHAKDDFVNYKNSVVYAEALQKYNVPVELLVFEKGGHGFGMNNKQSAIQWPDELLKWMKKMKFIP